MFSHKRKKYIIDFNKFNSPFNLTREGEFVNVKLVGEYWATEIHSELEKIRAESEAYIQCRDSLRRGSSFRVGGYKITLSNSNIIKYESHGLGKFGYLSGLYVDVNASVDFKIS